MLCYNVFKSKSTTAPSITAAILGGDVKNTYSKTQINTVEYSEPIIRISFKDLSVPDQRISFPKVQKLSVADELKKLKSLLDEGIITQEEFDAQKSKLL